MAAILVSLACGCSPETQYKTLSFFFDGVPPPGGATKESGTRGKAEGPGEEQKKNIFRGHGPYAAKLCEGCHVRGTNKLIMPVEELCFTCHTLDIRKKYVHGPLASGGCIVCHAPHGSNYAFYLVSEPRDFCLHCHDKKAVYSAEVHRDIQEECTVCHDAHSSDVRYLLK